MDIRQLQPEAEVAYELETSGTPISIKFKLGFVTVDAIPDYVREGDLGRPRISSILRKAVTDAIHDWDLTEGDQPLPCTRENKDKYLPLLFGLKVKEPKAESETEGEAEGDAKVANVLDSVLVMKLANFAATPENFLKN